MNVYIDGYNLYHGLTEQYGKKYSWLNIHDFAASLLRDHQEVASVKYFTSEAPSGSTSGSWQRQQRYWKALETLAPAVQLIKGKYRAKATRCAACGTEEAACQTCGRKLVFRNEKMTDVNIAIHLVRDACAEAFDVAVLVGGDTDLLNAVRMVKTMRRIILAFPPRRSNNDMKDAATTSFVISERNFKRSQFGEVVTLPRGATVTRPAEWR